MAPHKHFDDRIDELTQSLLTMSHDVEELLEAAVDLVVDADGTAPESIVEGDRKVDEAEVAIEETCIELLALHQPMASDLREIVTVLKINNDLERIGDHAVNIAHSVAELRDMGHQPPVPPELQEMARLSRSMLREALHAFVDGDADLAREVTSRDDRVDALHESTIRVMLTHMPEENISACLQVILISRNLERVADLATNIGEDVVYMVQGTTIRHRAGSGSG